MSGLVIGGVEMPVPGLQVLNWHDDPSLRLKVGEDCRARRGGTVNGIVFHTTMGLPKVYTADARLPVRSGAGPDKSAGSRIAKWWAVDGRQAGAHIVVDWDGSVACLADLSETTCFHAGPVNDLTIGIEIYQGTDGAVYQDQLWACVKLTDFLTREFGIQRQVQWPYHGRPVPRLSSEPSNVWGVYGHRDVSSTRGYGDPGSEVLELLLHVGYDAVDFDSGSDLELWRGRQRYLNSVYNAGLLEDGVPGPATRAALLAASYPRGMWLTRPGDR